MNKENAKDYIVEYWQERSPEFARLRKQELQSEKQLLWKQEIVAKLPSQGPLRILDVGCGAGFFSIILAKEGHIVTGIDITPGMITMAQQLAKEEQIAANFMVMDAENLELEANTFDVVIARNVTWNLPLPDKAYAEWLRVLKSGGILLNYDAEYAAHRNDHLPEINAHSSVTKDQNKKCNAIYSMLEISNYPRPRWDVELLASLGVTCEVDLDVNKRIYPKQDWFYSPAAVFGVKVIKPL